MMNDQAKTKGQLINELFELRQRIAELGASERQPKSSKVVLDMFQGDIHQVGKNILK